MYQSHHVDAVYGVVCAQMPTIGRDDVEAWLEEISTSHVEWLKYQPMLSTGQFADVALRFVMSLQAESVERVEKVELAKVARKRAPRRVVRKRPTYTIDDFKGSWNLCRVWAEHGYGRDRRNDLY
tara:strand:+ start:341 stop:715 length:375 start_codon:yes stop_codon:yes gene_type:complete